MSFKIAFFDIDNTLYDWRSRSFVPSAIEAIKRLNKEGVYVMLATARPYHSMKHFGMYDLGFHIDGYIVSAGAVSVFHNKTIHKQLMDKKIMRKFVNRLLELHLTAEVVTPRSRYLLAPADEYLYKFHEAFTDIIPIEHPYHGGDSTGLLLHAPYEYDEMLQREFPTIGYYRFHEYGVDVMPGPRTKGDAIKSVLDYLGLKKEDAIAFGDDLQDMSMAESAYFVCVCNGREEVKAVANEVCEDIVEDGVAKALARHFGW